MTTLAAIVLASLTGGALSVLLAWLVVVRLNPRLLSTFVSVAVGALLGAVFLDLLPHIFERTNDYHTVSATLLIGILVFFVLEKLLIWRHAHEHTEDGHHLHLHAHAAHHHGAPGDHDSDAAAVPKHTGALILIGDAFHNFVDGIVIAGAFMADFRLGLVTAIAIIAHEIPQELGDFLVLISSGMERRRALLFNGLSSMASVAGGVLGYFALSFVEQAIPAVLGFAVASMLYIAVADLIPTLQRRQGLKALVSQTAFILTGVAIIAVTHSFMHH